MITNDERRRVADAVRAMGEKFYSQETWDEVRASLGFVDGDGSVAEIMARLADLIESTNVTPDDVSDVDREALLKLAEDVRGYCIQRQIEPWVAGRIYDRIREACGEVRP